MIGAVPPYLFQRRLNTGEAIHDHHERVAGNSDARRGRVVVDHRKYSTPLRETQPGEDTDTELL